MPESFIVDGRGIIRYQHIGPIEPDDVPTILREWEAARVKRLVFAALAADRLPRRLLADSDLPAARWANRAVARCRARKRRRKALMEELRCLVCQGQSIADSDAELAGDMRAHGPRSGSPRAKSPRQVRRWLIERYGNWVSYRPPVEPVTWPLWRRRCCCCSPEHGCCASGWCGGAA